MSLGYLEIRLGFTCRGDGSAGAQNIPWELIRSTATWEVAMTRSQIKRFQQRLEARRAELQRRLWSRRPTLAIEMRGDPLEQARALSERDLAVRTIHAEAASLRQVEAALRHIREGTFGQCVSCDREIPLKRLQAVPWSPYCVICQEKAEQAGGPAAGEPWEEPLALAS